MDILELIGTMKQREAAAAMGVSEALVSLLLSGKRPWRREVLVSAQRAWPDRLDMAATLTRVNPDWTPERVSAEVRVINAMTLVPAEAAS